MISVGRMICIILGISVLIGCDSRTKDQILADKIRLDYETVFKDNTYCFFIGNVTFPFIETNSETTEENQFNIWLNNERERRLELFSQLGLLQKNDIAEGVEYELTDIGKNAFREKAAYLNDSRAETPFCFGSLQIENIEIVHLDDERKKYATMDYKVVDTPDWAKSQLFQNYFYAHNDERNGINSYPAINDLPKTLKVNLKNPHGEGIYLSNLGKISQLFSVSYTYDLDNPDKEPEIISEYSFGYYDINLAKKLFIYSNSREEAMSYWGEPDPIVYQRVKLPEYIIKANNQMLTLGEDSFYISNGKPKLIQFDLQKWPNPYLDQHTEGKYEVTFDPDGSFNVVSFNLKPLGPIQYAHTIKRNVDLKDGKPKWQAILEYRVYNDYHRSVIDYHTGEAGQIIGMSSNVDEYNRKFIPLYDNKERLIQFGDIKLQYKNNLLIERNNNLVKTNYFYDQQDRLIKSISYDKKFGAMYDMKYGTFKKDRECVFSNHNSIGDWTTIKCDRMLEAHRQLTYY